MASRPGVRLWRWRANPLRRRSDIAEAWLLLATALVMALGGAVLGMLAQQAVWDTAQRQRAARQQVPAVLLEDARPVEHVSPYVGSGGDGARARVRWVAPDGSQRTGQVHVEAGTRKGGAVEIWTDVSGRPAGEPPGPLSAAAQSALAAALTTTAFAGLVLAVCHGLRARLDRGRDAQWDREWAAFCARWWPRAP